MRKLHLVGCTPDLEGLVFTARRGSKSGGYVVAIEDGLVDAIEQARRSRNGEPDSAPSTPATAKADETRSARPESSSLTPREIQARLRAGRSIQQVANEAQVSVEWVERFAIPIIAEQAKIVELARAATYSKPRLGPSTQPLGESVTWNLADRGVLVSEDGGMTWTAHQVRHSTWVVRLRYRSRNRSQDASWHFNVETRELTARNRLASEVAHIERGRRRRPGGRLRAAATVDALAVRTAKPAPAKRAATASKKTATKKTATKKTATKKTAAKKTAAKKTAAKKSVARSSASAAPARKRTAPRKSPAAKSASRKSAGTKSGVSRAAAKKAPARKAPSKKAPARKVPSQKSTAKRSRATRRAPKRAAGGVAAGNRRAARSRPAKAQTRSAAVRVKSPQPERIGTTWTPEVSQRHAQYQSPQPKVAPAQPGQPQAFFLPPSMRDQASPQMANAPVARPAPSPAPASVASPNGSQRDPHAVRIKPAPADLPMPAELPIDIVDNEQLDLTTLLDDEPPRARSERPVVKIRPRGIGGFSPAPAG